MSDAERSVAGSSLTRYFEFWSPVEYRRVVWERRYCIMASMEREDGEVDSVRLLSLCWCSCAVWKMPIVRSAVDVDVVYFVRRT